MAYQPEPNDSAAANRPAGYELLSEVRQQQAEAALDMAARLYRQARNRRTRHERALDRERAKLVSHEADKETMTAMLDRAFRSADSRTSTKLIQELLAERGIPSIFSPFARFGLWLFRLLALVWPRLFVAAFKWVLRHKTKEVVITGDLQRLLKHARRRHTEGVNLTVNRLGEMILGEAEAAAKTRDDCELLAQPEVECLSVKASNLYSQVSALGHERSVQKMVEQLRPRLRLALAHRRPNGQPKLVNLDMEEYRDMAITLEAFRRVLDEPAFHQLTVSLAVQTYLPDTYGEVESLLAWARERYAAGRAPIRLRVVKGANRAMELVESSVKGWPCPTYHRKVEADACWKAVIELVTRPENIQVCRLGVATHNVFDLCWAANLIQERGVESACDFEMLEGMVNHVQREVQAMVGPVLLYAPVVRPAQFLTAIAYLIRRFDELTDPENFLSHIFGVTPESKEWTRLADTFVESLWYMDRLSVTRKRTQDRREPPVELPPPQALAEFRNEPDTDWTAAGNREWLEQTVIRRIQEIRSGSAPILRLSDIAGVPAKTRASTLVVDRSQPEVLIGEVELADRADLGQMLAVAHKAVSGWSGRSAKGRQQVLNRAAHNFRVARGELLAWAAVDVGKTFDQTDGEVSEAVDFGMMYPMAAVHFYDELGHLRLRPLGGGVIAVICPWNFPVAIPAGGVFAALATGNAVILKPSPEAYLATSRIADLFWEAGVPKDVLQVLNCDNEVAAQLVADKRLDGVIFTGSTATADRIIAARPERPLSAETGGKNATIVTAKADRELAIRHIADSFRNNGQKCSATSLLLLPPELYRDKRFLEQLKDAVASLPVGPADDPASVITPLVRDPNPDLERGLTQLEPGESWLLEPRRVNDRQDFWTPGIKLGVQRGSFTHRTELFGPVLGVMLIADLAEALQVVEETGRGLTLGIESLDHTEIDYVVDRAPAGVVYVNRNTVGAIVERQTFGGWRDSRRGPGLHAGFINYVTSFMSVHESPYLEGDPPYWVPFDNDWSGVRNGERCEAVYRRLLMPMYHRRLTEEGDRSEQHRAAVSVASQLWDWLRFFARDHRPAVNTRGEDNRHRYRPLGELTIRVTEADTSRTALARLSAAAIAGNQFLISVSSPALLKRPYLQRVELAGSQLGLTGILVESDEQLATRLQTAPWHTVRFAGPDAVPQAVWEAVRQNPRIHVACRPVLRTGRLELLHYVQEQSVAEVYHRYGGNLRPKDLD
jgi:RHH-type proline utilization regulon transcriptional repressor/proline dehydrogenase/delta 1-pyrroline-5-carboxylate dehydrogenase